MAPPPVELGRPTFVPGWLEMTTPLPPAFPPALLGGAAAEPRSSGPPAPVPLLPRPLPERALPPPTLGGGGTTLADPNCVDPDLPPFPWDPFPDEPPPDNDWLSMLAGGGTAWALSVPVPDLASAPPPEAEGGGGTGWERMSPLRVLPQLLRSRLTWEGGGATTAGAGSESLGAEDRSRGGAETGGAITSVVCDSGTRELARSRGVSRAGATTVGAIEFPARILSWETSGAGAMGAEVSADAFRVLWETSGAGGTALAAKLFWLRFVDAFNSGEGGMASRAGSERVVSEACKPSAGGGPGFALKASRLATAESLWGRFNLGASTIFSPGSSPRATLIAWVRWWACSPPARPDLPACAPPRSVVFGSSSPE